MKPSDAIALVRRLRDAFPQRDITVETIKLYAEKIVDLPAHDVAQAVERLIATVDWFPTIAQIKRAVFDATSGLPTPESAWVMVGGCVKDHPVLDGMIWDGLDTLPDAVQRAAYAIGPDDIARGDGAARAHFMRIYAEMREGEYRLRSVPALPAPVDDTPRLERTASIAEVLPDVLRDMEDPTDQAPPRAGGR